MSADRQLSIEEVVEKLNISVDTLNSWIKNDKFPVSSGGTIVTFNEGDIDKWISKHLQSANQRIQDHHQNSLSATASPTRIGRSMLDFVKRGCIRYNIEGTTVEEVIHNAMAEFPLPNGISHAEIAQLILDRERIVTTALCKGVAVPHTNKPILSNPEEECVGIFFLRNPVDFKALDRKPVSVIFIMLSAGRRTHLQMLQRISYFCTKDDFIELIHGKAKPNDILTYLEKNRQILE